MSKLSTDGIGKQVIKTIVLCKIRSNSDLLVMHADKEGQTVVLDKAYFESVCILLDGDPHVLLHNHPAGEYLQD